MLTGSQASSESGPASRLVAVGLVAVIYFAIVAAHQLTPYLAIAGVAALVLLGLVRPWWLPLVLVSIAGAYLVPHYTLISSQFGGLFSGGNPIENASGVRGISGSSAERTTATVVHALAACMWLSALASIVVRRRSLGTVAVPAILAFSPFIILGAQSYRGEAIYRVFLFSAPWCALLIAGALAEIRVLAWRWLATAMACTVFLAAGLQGLYGPVAVDAYTPAELAASIWLYGHAAPGSLLVLAADDFPALEVADYASYDVQVVPADPQTGASWLDEGNVYQVEAWIGSLGHTGAYVVFSRSMAAYTRYFGAPQGYARLASAARNRPTWSVVYQNADATIYRVEA
jgi:hypothetical protein